MMNIDMPRLWSVVLGTILVTVVAGLLSLVILLLVLLYRRFRPKTSDVPMACRGAAAIAVFFGVAFVISGGFHSAAVVSMALKNTHPYGALEILRFTTGALLVFTGAMNVALSRAIRAGRRWAIGVGVAVNLLLWVHLVFVLPLPGTSTSVATALGLWSMYLLWLGAAAFASRRGDDRLQPRSASKAPSTMTAASSAGA